MNRFRRIGECNRCGQCCGAEGSPNQDNPWPGSWPVSLRNWRKDDVEAMWPQAKLIPLPTHGGQTSGVSNVQGKKYPYVWIEGHAVCKATADGYSLECPFLEGLPGAEERPCALVGTKHEWMWEKACEQNPPTTFRTQAQVEQWHQDHPLCSYEYIEERP